MAGFTDTYEDKIINHFFRNSSQTPDANLYAGLFTQAPADAGTGGTEVSAGDYSRQAITFSAASNRVVSNSGLITFTTSAAGAWGTVVHLGIWNASTAGTLVAFGPLRTALAVNPGSAVSFAATKITVTMSSNLSVPYANKILNHFLRNSSQTPDATVYHAMYLTPPADDGTGGSECAAGWYARRAITFGAPTNGVSSNSSTINHVTNAPSDGGVLLHSVLANNATRQAGEAILTTAFQTGIAAAVGSTVDFPGGQITVQID